MNAAIINSRNEVVFTADVAEGVREIEIAGDLTIEGYPVNRKTYRVSRSKRNIEKAKYVDPLSKRTHGNLEFYI